MSQTIDAVIYAQGKVHLLEEIKIGKKRRAILTILDDDEIEQTDVSLVGSMELLADDLEIGSREIAKMFNQSLKESINNLKE